MSADLQLALSEFGMLFPDMSSHSSTPRDAVGAGAEAEADTAELSAMPAPGPALTNPRTTGAEQTGYAGPISAVIGRAKDMIEKVPTIQRAENHPTSLSLLHAL